MKKDKEDLLDECVEKLRSGRDVDEVLREHPNEANELRPLLELAMELEQVPDPVPSWHGLAHVVNALSRPKRQSNRSVWRWLQGFLALPVMARAVTVSLLAIALVWGTTAASSNAMPGDLLYPIKLLTERARFYLTINSAQKAELRIVYSAKRLKEAVKKQQLEGELDEGLLKAMLEEARLAVLQSAGLPKTDRDLVVARAAAVTDYQARMLTNLQTNAPEQVREKVNRWVDMCRNRGNWMRGIMAEPDEQAPSDQGRPGRTPANESARRRSERWMQRCPPCW